MTLEELNSISQIVAAIAVVVSLIFVVLQLRQTESTQRAAMLQARTQRGMDMALRGSEADTVEAMGYIIRVDPAATPIHFMQVTSFLRAMVLNLDDVEWQRKAGMLDRDALDNTVAPMRQFFSLPGIRAIWQMSRGAFAPRTVALVDKLVIEDRALQPVTDPVAAWRSIATQLAATVETVSAS